MAASIYITNRCRVTIEHENNRYEYVLENVKVNSDSGVVEFGVEFGVPIQYYGKKNEIEISGTHVPEPFDNDLYPQYGTLDHNLGKLLARAVMRGDKVAANALVDRILETRDDTMRSR